MTTIMLVTLAIMGLCLLTVALIALRNRVIFRMALRNIPRRKAQTTLIMIGLMLSTLIIAASLTTGDTLDYSITKTTYDGLGQVDETLAFVADNAGADNQGQISLNNTPIDTSIVDQLEANPAIAGNPDIQGFLPLLTIGVPAINPANNFNESAVTMTGIDPTRLANFGGLRDVNGNPIDIGALPPPQGDLGGACGNGAPPASAVISKTLADNLEARVNDVITVFYKSQPCRLMVAGIANDSILTGLNLESQTAGQNGIAVPLPWLQQLTGLEGKARYIAVSNTGDVEGGKARTNAVVPALKRAISELPGDASRQVGVNPIKADAVRGAELAGNVFTSLFIVLGLFSVAAGILLIFLIFMMLAAERRAEMGMARAVGMKRRHLIQGFIAEGAAYDLGAALLGAALGVLVAFAIAGLMGRLIGQFFSITPQATPRSLIVAYALGVTVTFVTILFASVRSSRLNIVQAIRDLPEFKISQRSKPKLKSWWPWSVLNFARRIFGYYIGWWATILAVGGVLGINVGANRANAFFYAGGVSLLGLGLALLLRRWLPSRLVYSIVAALELLYWLSPDSWRNKLFPTVDGGFEMFFLSGIMMVTFATLLIMWNAEAITWAMGQLGRVATRWIPAIKTAVAYPLAAKGRTGLTIAMFAMVIFSLVTISTINSNFANLFSSDQATGGWDIGVLASNTNPLGDLKAELQAVNSQVDTNNFGDTGRLSSVSQFNSQVRNVGDTQWQRYLLNGMDAGYIRHAATDIPLQARAIGYASDADVWNAVASDPSLIVVDSASTQSGDFVEGQSAFRLEGVNGAQPFAPIPIELRNSSSGATAGVKVIGVIDSKVSTAFGLFLNDTQRSAVYPTPDYQTTFVALKLTTDAQSKDIAKQIKADLISKGVLATSLRDAIQQQLSISNGFFKLLQGFMGLGLFVGIAALGVISFRAVVERRQQIGMLRALGYQKNMVAASFLLESLVIALLGIGSGTILALILSYNLITSGTVSDGSTFTGFTVPWAVIGFFIVASLLAAALMTWIPARKASSVPIAEALRYE